MTTPIAAPVTSEPTHPCVRCGAPIALEDGMCDACNPLGLAQPAASQAHGTVFLAIGAAIVGLALIANFAVAGIGPFSANVSAVVPDPLGLKVTFNVTNDGSRPGSTTCRIFDPSLGLGPETAYVQTPRIDAGATIALDQVVTGLGTAPRSLTVKCSDL
jgi:hypothetical protein